MAGRKSQEPAAPESAIYEMPSVAGKARQKNEGCRIPEAVLRRLPRYFRILRELINSDVLRVSSGELAGIMGATASQVRQDLSCFGALGQQGYGYTVKSLYTKISETLGTGRRYTAVAVGASDICRRLIADRVLEQRGVTLKAVFDPDASRVGADCGGLTVRGTEGFVGFCNDSSADIAVITAAAQDVPALLDLISQTDIRGIWNFSLYEISPNEKTAVQNVFVGDSLMLLTYEITKDNDDKN